MSGQASAEAPLSQGDPKPVAGEVRAEGFVYAINSDGGSLSLTGWSGSAPEGDVAVPSEVLSGMNSYTVTAIGVPGPDGCAASVFEGSSIASVSIPESVNAVADGAFSNCATLSRVSVSSKNESLASFDGMLFSKDLSSLLLVPEGKEGVALIPDPAVTVPAGAFSRTPGLPAVRAGEGSASFSSRDGILYSKDMSVLMACPPGSSDAVVVPESVDVVASKAFTGCAVASITVLGDVREIAADAYEDGARASAVVAIPVGEAYDNRRAVWEAAGFSHFAEPARPGDVSVPAAPGGEDGSDAEGGPEASGLAFELLDDYTLSVFWEGPEGPAGDIEVPTSAEVGGVSYRVSTVADAAFAGCSGLTGVELPAGLTHVGERAFEATGIAELWLPASVAYVGPRALAACPSLGRVVALGTPDAAPDALAECSGVSVYCPAGSEASWNMGLPAAGNHLLPYGASLAEDPLQLEEGQSASLLDGGLLLAPEPVEASYAYAAKPLSVDADGLATGKAIGSSEVSVALALDGVQLARAARAVEVTEAPSPSATQENDGANQQGFAARTVRLLGSVFPEELRSGADAAADGEVFASADGELTFAVLPGETGAHGVSVKLSSGYAPENVVIPSMVEHEGIAYAVTEVAEAGFGNCTSLGAIELPDSVNSIAKNAFQGCTSLKTVDIGSGVSSVPASTFSGCSALQSILVSTSVNSVDTIAFDDTTKRGAYVVLCAEDEAAFEAAKRVWVQAGFDESLVIAAEGTLPTQGGTRNGSWKLGSDGTLHIRSEQVGAVVQDLGWTESSHSSGGWAPVRGFVERIDLDPTIDAVNMNWWFSDMTRLVEAPSFDIPASVKGAIGLYYGCASLVSLPEGFKLPDSLGEIRNMFMGCTSLKALPDGFAIPCGSEESPLQPGVFFMDCVSLERLPESFVFQEGSTAMVVNGMFMNCSSLEELPSGFCFPDSVKQADGAFGGCSSLRALPDGFRVPGKLEVSQKMFEGCSSLVSLPGGFSLPESLLNAHLMFSGCSSLVSLPEGFTIPVNRDINIERLFEGCSSLVSLPALFRIPARIGGTIKLNNLFDGCVSLASLPDGLTVPSDLDPNGMKGLFRNCASLTVLPDGFAFPADQAQAATDAGESPFWCDVEPGGPRVATYYAGSDAAVFAYDWEGDNRTLVTDASDMGGFGMKHVSFKVQSADEGAAFPWETRSVAWTDKQGVLANPGEPQLEGYTFSGWCTDEGCLEPFDFTTPLETDRELYGKWIVHGGRGTVEGALPVDGDAGSAWWSITADGAFNIKCEDGGSVADLGMRWNDDRTKYWQPYTNDVRSLNMHKDVKTRSMTMWFANMKNLEDVREGFFITDNCIWTTHLFYGDPNLRYLPNGFFPKQSSIVDVWGMFQGCSGLEELPADFALPPSVTAMGCLFYSAKSLRSLPESFELHEGIEGMNESFYGCSSLRSLPENFVIPSSATSIASAFVNCSRLSSLPAGLLRNLSEKAKNQVNALHTNPKNDSIGVFGFSSGVVAGSLPTYFPASKEQQDLIQWAAQKRVLVTEPADEGKTLVKLMLPNENGEGHFLWQNLMVPKDATMSAPAAAPRKGATFTGWCVDAGCATRFDFALDVVPAGGLTLYADYRANNGELPTTDGGFNASWELNDNGTLTIACEPGATIADFGWLGGRSDFGYPVMAADGLSEHWGPLRDLVTRIEMPSDARVEGGVDFWFADMKNLVDASGVFLPDGIVSARGVFQGDERLQLLSDGLDVPDGVVDASVMFAGCTALKGLPGGFALPVTLTDAAGLFDGCASLATLPSSLELPKSLKVARGMVAHCSSLEYLPAGFVPHEGLEDMGCMLLESTFLKGLPEGFAIPSSASDVVSLFYHCSSLETLPTSFRIPDDVATTDFESMFNGCESLRALPEGFAVPAKAENAHCMFKLCKSLTRLPASLDLSAWADTTKVRSTQSFLLAGEPFDSTPLVTYYPGDAAKVLGAQWWKQWNRTLVDGSDGVPSGSFEIAFKLQAPGEAIARPWITDLTATDAEGVQRLTDPGAPERFGYAFSGWKDEATGLPFDFSKPVTASAVLVGSYVAIVEFEAPLSAKVTVDAQGTVSPAPMRFVSHAPVELLIKSVEASVAPGASKLFANPQDLAKTRINVGLGNKSVSLALGERETYIGSIASASAACPGKLDGSIGLNLNGAQIDYQPGDDITSFAKLTWTVEVQP